MPIIKSSADLRNHYNEISEICHKQGEPVFITKNGRGDLAVMSIEVYDQLVERFELYSQLKEGLDDVKEGKEKPLTQAISEIRKNRKHE